MAAATVDSAGARITLKEIEEEVFNKSSLTKVTNKGKSLKGQKNVKIEGFDFLNSEGKDLKMLNVTNCQDVIIRRCRFSGKNLVDVALNITGASTKRVIVEYCIFENMTSKVSNGGEPIRIGNSQHSGCEFECEVRKCIFRNLRADPETISLKSARNQVRDCYFIDNKSMVTVRHGGYADIHHNTFEGNNGVRLLGYGNIVRDNLFKDNSATDKMSPIQVQHADKSKDPNWTDVKTPSGKEGNSHAIYAQCTDNEIRDNEFVNCKNKIYYRKGKSLAPKNLKIAESKPEQPEQPKPEEPPTPPTPEPEQPEQPEESTIPECGICHNEPATKKLTLSIYVGADHYESTRTALIDLLKKLRADAITEGGGQPGL